MLFELVTENQVMRHNFEDFNSFQQNTTSNLASALSVGLAGRITKSLLDRSWFEQIPPFQSVQNR